MSDLPYSDPSNPALPSPLFSDISAVRGDHMRANNAAIFADLEELNTRNPELVALTGGSFKTAALANANTYNGRSFYTCTAGVSDTPSAGAWRVIGYWNPSDSSGRFVAIADTTLETWEINYSGAAWGTWTQLTDASGNLTRNVTGNLTGNADTATLAAGASSIKETGIGTETVRTKIIEIGDWNMDNSSGRGVNHGLTVSKIRSVRAFVRNDAASMLFDLCTAANNNDPYLVAGGVKYVSQSVVYLERRTGGMFDDVDFNSTGFNRGWITIEYVD